MQLSRTAVKILLATNRHIHRNICSGVQNFNVPNTIIIHGESSQGTYHSVLDKVDADISTITPHFPPSFNLAAYVNSSESLQNLLKLNVNLSKIEKKPYVAEKILKLDFEKDIKGHIFFLNDYVDAEALGEFITKNPLILCQPLEDLEVRINYLKSKCFSNIQIRRIISKNPFWLMFSTKRIDKRLGYFQGKFTLSGEEVRLLSTKQPKIITYNLHHINTNTFVIKEEMGFEDNEIKQMILNKPKLWMIDQKCLLERFNYFHNVMKIPHSMLLQFPEVLLCRNFRVKQRHLFLQKLGRDQFDPTKENYVPIKALVEKTDIEFCRNYAKCNIDDFNVFLKTL
ncbi:transcription termination factor 3, mitochondrial [Pectinophora gossypiella]|uniref:Transcription termination factor 3, mitochondrial n=1 Tax=Pectinophora gossypiella TaxID=13191 RepID=A0A1E1WD13_PECGO|nr:transcription termination factor 3, mitochondrial [Pectinophora gossypiella]